MGVPPSLGVWANRAELGVPPIHTKPTRWPYGGICGLILPPGVDSYRNLTGGGQGVGCFISLRAQTAHNTKTFETEWYLKLFRPHLAADKLNNNIRSHRHAESRFRHARDERIAEWQNRQRVLFADVQKFLDGTALTDVVLEYDNARDKEIDQLRSTIADEAVRDTLIEKAKQDNPYRLWQAIENTLGAKKVTDIKVLKNQIDFGIVDHTNHHGSLCSRYRPEISHTSLDLFRAYLVPCYSGQR